eukprot:CAMPEP_0181290064 /NCGR_PEP_ID=MMETSP1101-20121128/1219_1 /TAXON_ID=46948 /ORGANISM="Rhodomonas abbreviata, Strain Caron Lab Isolate" /LENGTH=235 /DNA_ID=CAMNT_0023394333 /DNA_START=219 /DNA_END=926 /DNA_ORIENTATION=-
MSSVQLSLLVLCFVVPSSAYMTNYACNTTQQLIEGQGLTNTGDPAKVEFFCKDFVQYTAACDLDNDPQLGFNPSCNNTFAIQVFSNFQRALSVYSCGEYSRIWTCDHCTAAYKRWLCAALYRRCKNNDTTVTGGECETGFVRTNERALPDCVMATCSDVCYDVVRKCPVHLEFRCPPVDDQREYNETNCNNLERESPTSARRAGTSAASPLLPSLQGAMAGGVALASLLLRTRRA